MSNLRYDQKGIKVSKDRQIHKINLNCWCDLEKLIICI